MNAQICPKVVKNTNAINLFNTIIEREMTSDCIINNAICNKRERDNTKAINFYFETINKNSKLQYNFRKTL